MAHITNIKYRPSFAITGTNQDLKAFLFDCMRQGFQVSAACSFFRDDYEHCLIPPYAYDAFQFDNIKLQTLASDSYKTDRLFVLPEEHEAAMAEVRFINQGPYYDLTQLETERLAWSLATFTEATPLGSLAKLRSEIDEIEKNIYAGETDAVEYADALMCLLDAAGREGLTVQGILNAFAVKLNINKARRWTKNADNSYSHVK